MMEKHNEETRKQGKKLARNWNSTQGIIVSLWEDLSRRKHKAMSVLN